nr:hypothetical protein CFP56_22471 [Quercus suber]
MRTAEIEGGRTGLGPVIYFGRAVGQMLCFRFHIVRMYCRAGHVPGIPLSRGTEGKGYGRMSREEQPLGRSWQVSCRSHRLSAGNDSPGAIVLVSTGRGGSYADVIHDGDERLPPACHLRTLRPTKTVT